MESAQLGKLERAGWGLQRAMMRHQAPVHRILLAAQGALLTRGAEEHGRQPAAPWGPRAPGGLGRVAGGSALVGQLWSAGRCSPILSCGCAHRPGWICSDPGQRPRLSEPLPCLGGGLQGPHAVLLDSKRAVMAPHGHVHLPLPAGSLQLLEQQVVGGEQAKNKDLKEKHKRRKRYADERKKQLVAALQNSDEDGGDWVLLNVYDSIQEEVRAKSKLLEKMQRKVRPPTPRWPSVGVRKSAVIQCRPWRQSQ